MKVLILGATGATGRLLVEQLLERGHEVKAIVRSAKRIPDSIRKHDKLNLITADLMSLDDSELQTYVKDCDAVASCLGHNITFKGMYGHPRRLVTDAARRFCEAIRENDHKKAVKYVLMNTTGNRNRDLKEKISFGQRVVTSLLRLVLPPHVDNEKAADYLRISVGQNDKHIEWTAVRPDGLINEENVTEYEIYTSPIRNPIFNPGKTSRINVAHFMAELTSKEDLWKKWKGQMPVIYNTDINDKKNIKKT